MELSLIYVIILLLNMFEFSSGIVYNKGDTERRFACSSQGYPKENEIIKLFLSTENLIIQCFFQAENENLSKEMLSIFTSGGLAPSLGIINSTYHGIFHFNLTLYSDRVFWLIDIPRGNITGNTDIAAVEEWLVRITLHKGLNIYATEGTLLDIVREPILQWTLGRAMVKHEVKTLYPHVIDIKVTKCPCANDVAIIGFVLNTTYNGVFIGLTFSGFWNYGSTMWFDLTENIYTSLHEEHSGLSLIDMVLTNHVLVILTSLGVFVSKDLRYPSGKILKFSRADFCGFERVDYIKGKLWYNERCFANKEHFEVDYITITFDRNRTLSESSSCFFGKEPFVEWFPCLPDQDKIATYMCSNVVTFLMDQEHDAGVYLLYDKLKKTTIASVNVISKNNPNSKPKFPPFLFPPSFSSPVGMVFHPRSHFLYAYGNQIWLSVDGGNTFGLLADFHDDIVKTSYHSYYTSDITFICLSGRVFLTKAGLGIYSEIGTIKNKVFALYYDHLGFIHKLTPDHSEDGGVFEGFGNSRSIFGQPPDMGFNTALAPQFLSFSEVIFFAYVPLDEPPETIHTKKFNNMHYEKLIQSSKSGKAHIRKILQHKTPKGFLSSVIAETVNAFGLEDENESPCLSSSLLIDKTSNFTYKLTLTLQTADSSFKTSDIEKTVVIPGYSSFLITEILDPSNALALATMPQSVPLNMTFVRESWFLYNFGSVNGRKWSIFSKPCNYWFQQSDDSLSLNVVKYIDLGNSQVFKVKIIPNSNRFQIIDYPLVEVSVGNPMLLEVKVEGAFDDTNSYLVEISVTSKSLRQGSTSLALIAWAASTQCFVTTVVTTLKSSCSYLRAMQHVSNIIIPFEDWISGVHEDSQGFNMIKTLPVNYRPPSNMGIAIPLTDNFYNADPSKPIPRNLFRKSKETGKYKQCARVASREECNCTNDQKFSHAVAFSDCKEKVPRFKFPVIQYPISLEIFSENERIPVKSPYLVTVTEVNMRKNWKLKHFVPQNVKKLKNHLEAVLRVPVYNPSGLNISIRGSELFHFRVSVVPGVTFCNLVEEFQIYVDEVPLPFPGHTLIAVAAAVVLGGLIFTAFMLQLHNIHPWRAFRRWVRRNTINLSNTTIN
ncbi:cation channel sperm-associated auxiliary subunit beta [Marmota flaviventris]|uniref:cation channel sperm-associated auxiliary subunit beta n=1 Tax=Marmota flaviventris TaxID=93162 RepID=UPI003A84C15B